MMTSSKQRKFTFNCLLKDSVAFLNSNIYTNRVFHLVAYNKLLLSGFHKQTCSLHKLLAHTLESTNAFLNRYSFHLSKKGRH